MEWLMRRVATEAQERRWKELEAQRETLRDRVAELQSALAALETAGG